MNSNRLLLGFLLFLILFTTAYSSQQKLTTDPLEASALAKDAYIFAYPMLENYRTMYVEAASTENFNKFTRTETLFGPESKTVVRPNNDTIYSTAWLDLRAEPLIVELPAVSDRYFSLQLVDMYTHNFAYAGTRATGTGSVTLMVAGPYWEGEIPSGIDYIFHSDGEYVYCVIRTAVNSEKPGDLQRVLEIQQRCSLQTLGEYSGISCPETVETESFPPFDQTVADSAGFIGYFNFLLGHLKIHPSEEALIQSFSRIGVGPDKTFDPAELTESVREAIESPITETRT